MIPIHEGRDTQRPTAAMRPAHHTAASLLLLLATASTVRVGSPRISREPLSDALAAHPRAAMDTSIEPFVERLALEAVRGLFNSFMAWMSLRMLLSHKGGLGELMGGLNRTNPGAALDQPVANCSTTFADVAGIDEVVEELQEAVAYLRAPEKFTRLGARMPRGVLLEGVPGTGKTMLARACAGEAGVPFFSASASGFDEKYVGVGAQRVRALFAAARRAARRSGTRRGGGAAGAATARPPSEDRIDEADEARIDGDRVLSAGPCSDQVATNRSWCR